MAFNPLTEAECGQKNPLARLTSHLTHDHAFAEAHGHAFPSSSDQLVEQFLQETKSVPQSFRMDDLMREMHEIESQRSALPPIPASTIKDQIHDDAWAQQYIDDGKIFNDNVNSEAIWTEILSQEQNNAAVVDDWGTDNFPEILPGPSKVNASQQSAREFVEAVDDPKFVYSKFMRFMKQVGDGDVNLEDGRLTEEEAQSWSKEFLQNNNEAEAEKVAKKWEKDYEDDFNSKYWNNLQEELKQTLEGAESSENTWASEFDSYYTAPYNDYTFTEENPMFDIPDPLQRGKKLLEDGDLPSAVLCFEAAVKQEPENSEAWLLLGKTQAENEQDCNAIPALKKCIELEPNNLTALMALAVCYTNESYYSQAAQMLLKWLTNNPKYSDLVPPDFQLTGQVTSFLQPNQQRFIQDLYIKAALRQPVDIDYEVQCGLGVLFNLSGEYEKAADCFRAALSVKYDDAKLWNRLGATLANGSKSEEAVEAYHRALDLEPGFIRARYNVGIICINLRAYREAAEHFLTALNQQARGRDVKNSPAMSQMSDTIWSTLRMCISLLNKVELRAAVDNRDLETLNKAFDIV
ncbi:peroxisomal targeting signal 1 receptor isoform X1 [Tribolium castaneum]|uniref:Peroxisomal targeting signal 1 receptor n=1 Tax=Tribolium castaneum TaxID=7070 RepID=D6WZG5_TRICA|nr:PREDICTED: peroxisomal targeting signal 1 receptor isoform X1 [Tribolium castaneum]EFA09708.1 Peroxisomal targeting signal 1 receptor-like Protein [Tribolium castaneum]|eukprot:XP_970686.2 PREDICTED: peroxisomal targeting signal 1 receptor isoform X1 [Tribolium castaneum]